MNVRKGFVQYIVRTVEINWFDILILNYGKRNGTRVGLVSALDRQVNADVDPKKMHPFIARYCRSKKGCISKISLNALFSK